VNDFIRIDCIACILACGCMSTLCFSCAHIEGSCAHRLSCTYIVHTLTYVKINFGYKFDFFCIIATQKH